MGAVYEYTNNASEKTALKVSANTAVVGVNDVLEVDVSMRLKHPYVNNILDFRINKVVGNASKYAMVFPLAFGTVRDFYVKAKLTPKTFVPYVNQLLLGLLYIHSRNIIHNDIKPENILYYPEEDAVKYNDFGISSYNDPAFTHILAGTPSYIAPETLANSIVSFKSDIWQLGLTLLAIMFNEYPQEKILKVMKIDMAEVSDFYSEYKIKLAEIIEKTLQEQLENDFSYYILLSAMLKINPDERASVSELLKYAPVEKYYTEDAIIMSFYPGCRITYDYVDTHDLTRFVEVYNFFDYIANKSTNNDLKWAYVNGIALFNKMVTLNQIPGNSNGAIYVAVSCYSLSLKLINDSYYNRIKFLRLIEGATPKLDLLKLEAVEDAVFTILNYKVYTVNIYSFLKSNNVNYQFNDLKKYILTTRYEGELPFYAYKFMKLINVPTKPNIVAALYMGISK